MLDFQVSGLVVRGIGAALFLVGLATFALMFYQLEILKRDHPVKKVLRKLTFRAFLMVIGVFLVFAGPFSVKI